MYTYTVILYRSGRVFVLLGEHNIDHDIEQPLLTEVVQANTEIAALGKLLLKYYDASQQTQQHICPPCDKPCCDPDSEESHTQIMKGKAQSLSEHLAECQACTERVLGL